MKISDELIEKIELCVTDKDLKNRLLLGDPDAVSLLGSISGQGINPLDVMKSYENNTMDNLYQIAKKQVGMQELYNELCKEYENYILGIQDNTTYFK